MDIDSLEYKLKSKLESGQIDHEEYEELRKKFEKLGMLKRTAEKSSNVKVEGSKTIDSVDVEGSVILSGGVTVDGDVHCNNFSSSGFSKILGNLTVNTNASISGELSTDGSVHFNGPVTLTGTLRVDEDISSKKKVAVSGNIFANDLFLDEGMNIVGKLQAGTIHSKSVVKTTGTLNIQGIEAKEFGFKTQIIKGDKSVIEKDVVADIININGQLKNINLDLNLLSKLKLNLGNSKLGELINNTVESVVPALISDIEDITNELFEGLSKINDFMDIGISIYGGVKGKQIELSHVTIYGDVIGVDVQLGPKVEIFGKLIYSGTLDKNNNLDYEIIKEERK